MRSDIERRPKVRRNNVSALRLLLAVPLMLALALPALAAEQTGKLNGTVYDPDGVPLAGVTVTISSNVLMGKRRTQTAEDGSFLFFGLPPGKYTIEIEQSGFMPFRQENVTINIGGTASLDILLELPTAEETVVVTAKRPVVDKEKTNLGQNFDDEFLEEVPVGRSYQSVAQLAPGVVGGGNPNVHGGSLYSNQFLIDGINTTERTWTVTVAAEGSGTGTGGGGENGTGGTGDNGTGGTGGTGGENGEKTSSSFLLCGLLVAGVVVVIGLVGVIVLVMRRGGSSGGESETPEGEGPRGPEPAPGVGVSETGDSGAAGFSGEPSEGY